MAVKFKYRPTTQRVLEPIEDDWFSYGKFDPYNLDWDDKLPVMLDVETHGKDFNDIRLVQVFQEHKNEPAISIPT